MGNAFCKHFSSLLAQIEYLGVWKVLTKDLTHIFFDVPKSSFGSHKIVTVNIRSFTTILEAQKVSGVCFRVTMRWFVAKIEYSHRLKAPRKDTPRLPAVPVSKIFVWVSIMRSFQVPAKAGYRRTCARSLLTWMRHYLNELNLCSPNEDFGPSKNMWVMHFVSIFHHF